MCLSKCVKTSTLVVSVVFFGSFVESVSQTACEIQSLCCDRRDICYCTELERQVTGAALRRHINVVHLTWLIQYVVHLVSGVRESNVSNCI